jgi:hypothetical protein
VQLELRRQLILLRLKKSGHIWPIDEQSARAPEGWPGWPDGKQFALVLTHDVERARGLEKCNDLARIDEKFGFCASFNFVAEGYTVSNFLRHDLESRGFEVGVHGLLHDGSLYRSREEFARQAGRINEYLKQWGAVGFRSPSMYHNLGWIHDLDIEYDASTFDTDPFEPQPDGMRTIFPFLVRRHGFQRGYVELPYTLPQDFTLFILFQERNIEIWKRKLDWIAEQGGMALLITHPDFMTFNGMQTRFEEYPSGYYEEFLAYVRTRYEGRYWNALPKEISRWVRMAEAAGRRVYREVVYDKSF